MSAGVNDDLKPELEQAYPTPGPLMRISAQLFLRGTGAGAPRPKEQMPKAPRPPPRSSPKSDG